MSITMSDDDRELDAAAPMPPSGVRLARGR